MFRRDDYELGRRHIDVHSSVLLVLRSTENGVWRYVHIPYHPSRGVNPNPSDGPCEIPMQRSYRSPSVIVL